MSDALLSLLYIHIYCFLYRDCIYSCSHSCSYSSRAKPMHDSLRTGPGFPMQTRGCESLVYILGRMGHLRAPNLFCPGHGWRPYSCHLVQSLVTSDHSCSNLFHRYHRGLVQCHGPLGFAVSISLFESISSSLMLTTYPHSISSLLSITGIITSLIPYSWGLISVLGTPGNSVFVQLVTRARL